MALGCHILFVRQMTSKSKRDGKHLYYGRFILSPSMKGQVDIIDIAMRRVLLREIEGTCITRVKPFYIVNLSPLN
ncbi:hypothetical protein JHK82_012922 [Glycine max]|uniref:Uncharacterized protein n=2 Tax=Glycine subgen. Soja TaxID=1462606 RepID=A0A0R0JV70_SOYBN|nr:hypothetical protein JHK85_013283 [Glycine max]KAG5057945.1 hypothetical protein JHK86_012941 [Glycine max]KAG5154953.1 hypothetical protein JHK82_012922 [Glycine max]KAH1134297.1 hypothetical protein GYH30_012616 [Glycine max]RZC12379.1 DNA-directed RNA polymerase subunit alpha [Glycine soja]